MIDHLPRAKILSTRIILFGEDDVYRATAVINAVKGASKDATKHYYGGLASGDAR